MKKLLTFSMVMMCLHTMAQKPITQMPPGQIIKQQEIIKKVAENKAGIDKVLNAELVKVDLVVKNEIGSSEKFYNTRFISLADGIDQSYILTHVLEEPIFTDNKKTYTFLQKTNANVWGAIGKKTYRELLSNGLTVEINFNNRKSKPSERWGGEYSADFIVILYFSDGTRLDYPLQTLNLSNKGTWKSSTELKIIKKIAGSEIPDPAKPGSSGVH